jgi:hypothetical protein
MEFVASTLIIRGSNARIKTRTKARLVLLFGCCLTLVRVLILALEPRIINVEATNSRLIAGSTGL